MRSPMMSTAIVSKAWRASFNEWNVRGWAGIRTAFRDSQRDARSLRSLGLMKEAAWTPRPSNMGANSRSHS